jgi:hypothetical protein
VKASSSAMLSLFRVPSAFLFLNGREKKKQKKKEERKKTTKKQLLRPCFLQANSTSSKERCYDVLEAVGKAFMHS